MLLIDKPRGWTSFDVVHAVRRVMGVRKAGHAGTLDPLATGLLIVCTGRMTKQIDRYMAEEKEYRTTMFLGARTPSGDEETPVCETGSVEGVTGEQIAEILQSFVGKQAQVPPMHSAVKVKGRRLYKYAKKGIEVERPAREITIRSITPLRISVPEVEIAVVCSKGTYIRTLVDDIGKRLGCGAYVRALRRTRIGSFRVEHAVTMDGLGRLAAERDGREA